MDNIAFFGTMTFVFIAVLLVIGFGLSRLYNRASKEQAFVRTGLGGQKVVKDGGAFILPVFHEIIPINMQTLRLRVERGANDALITKDRLRVDVKAEFYVRVKPDAESIATAAQTLGKRTLNPQALSELIEGKFVDALRSVASGMEMQDLADKRPQFVLQVQNAVSEDLTKNGLELESVSLTGLDQTDIKFFNPNNAFDAEGLKKLTDITATRAKERNAIEQDNRVAMEEKNREANAKSLEIKQADEFARLEQERQVETRRAEQEAQLAEERAARKRQADLATIAAEEATETARVAQQQRIQESEIEAAKNLDIANQDKAIAIAKRSEEESKARAAAEEARAEAVKAAEAVRTVEAEASAERQKRVAVIQAEQVAEQEATRIRVISQAEYEAADAKAKAAERQAEADAKRYQVEAEGQRAINEAANTLSPEQAQLKIRLKLIDKMPEILEQLSKPIEKIDSIRIVQMPGFNGNYGNGNGAVASTGNVASDLSNVILNTRMQLPAIDAMAREVGIDLTKGLNGIIDGVMPTIDSAPAEVAEVEQSEAPVTKPATRQILMEDSVDQELAELKVRAGITPAPKTSK